MTYIFLFIIKLYTLLICSLKTFASGLPCLGVGRGLGKANKTLKATSKARRLYSDFKTKNQNATGKKRLKTKNKNARAMVVAYKQALLLAIVCILCD